MRSPSGLKGTDKILERASKSCQSVLDLRGQNITCTSIPQAIFANPFSRNLRVLELSCNGLQSLPSEIRHLTRLEELYLGRNRIDNLPKELGNLAHLRRLNVVHNQLREVPFWLNRLGELEWLNLSGNLIEVLPPWLLCLPKLNKLYIIQNLIENIPRTVYLSGLKELRKYFRTDVSKVHQCEDSGVNHVLMSPTNTNCGPKEDMKRMAVYLKESDGVVQHQMTPTLTSSEYDQVISKTYSQLDVVAMEYVPDHYSNTHCSTVVRLMESQQSQVQLLREQREMMLLRQELRKLNIDHLQYIKNQQQPVQFPLPRRKLDLSFLENPVDRRNRRCMTTSDYGTCSSLTEGTEVVEDLFIKRTDRCCSVVSILDDATNDNLQKLPRCCSHSNSICSSYNSNEQLLDVFDNECFSDRRRHIMHGDICVIIPEDNVSGFMQSEFFLEVTEHVSFSPKLKPLQVLASEVIEMEPHGAMFYPDDPAIISLPYDVSVGKNDHVVCMCSNTGVGKKTAWEAMSSEDYQIFPSHVEIRASHFSLFAVVVTKAYPEAHKMIRAGMGGCLYIPEVPGVEVLFPETSLLHDIDASVLVLYADEPYDIDHSDAQAFALATPVIRLGPHGCHFNPNTSDFVTVRLPLPNGKKILQRFGDRQLTFWCSSTTEGEDLHWQQFEPKFVHIDNDNDSICSVYFSVEHFSVFRALWDIVDAVLWEAKLSASNFIPIFQFYISCQALMSESEDGVRFAICIACYRFGKPLEGIGNFPILVGKDPAPKMISTGRLQIRWVNCFYLWQQCIISNIPKVQKCSCVVFIRS